MQGELSCYQKICEAYEGRQERVQDRMVMERDNKKRTMDGLHAEKKKFTVGVMGGGHCILDAMS